MATQLACRTWEFKDRALLNKMKISVLLKHHSQFMSTELILQFNLTNLMLNIVRMCLQHLILRVCTPQHQKDV